MPDNPGFDWLTYETVFNQKRFSRPNGQYKTHLYCLPRNEVIVWFRDGIDDDTVKALSAAFFPDEANALEHRDASAGSWPWKGKGERTMPPATPQEVPLRIGPGSVLHASGRVVLPYNEIDNDSGSLALGTGLFPLPRDGGLQAASVPQRRSPRPDLLDEKHHWGMWRTASRSCVMRLEPLTGAWPNRWRRSPDGWNLPGALDRDRAAGWDFGWAGLGAGGASGKRLGDGRPSSPMAHRLAADQLRHDFSVKTAASHVGEEYQDDKQRLDGNWIVACLRSDYLNLMKNDAAREGRTEDALVFVTELLTIAEREERPLGFGRNKKSAKDEWLAPQRDGVQVRDLGPLLEGANAGKMYMPPLSIPFVGWNDERSTIDFETRTHEFRDIRDDRWSDFWKEAWAILLGRAKALLLVRYALQSINPHTQNFLLEFERKGAGWASTGRLIVRDVQDTAISREVAWALHRSKDDELPPTKPDDPEKPEKHPLCGAFALEVLNHEFGPAREGAQETGTRISDKYTYDGTHLLWRLFSQFGKYATMDAQGRRIYGDGNPATVAQFLPDPDPAPAAAPPQDAPPQDAPPQDAPPPDALSPDASPQDASLQYAPPPPPPPEAPPPPKAPEALKFSVRVDDSKLRKAGENAAIDPAKKRETFVSRFTRWLEFRMAEWGLAHNRAYLHALEEALGHNFCVDWNCIEVMKEGALAVIEKKALPDPQRPTGLDAAVADLRAEAKSLAEAAKAWEDAASAIVHKHLGSEDGQKQIRAYRDGKWKGAAPKLTLRVTSGAKPCQYRKIGIQRFAPDKPDKPEKEWVDLTDQEGKVFLYQGAAADYRYRFDLKSGSWLKLPPPGVGGTHDLGWVQPPPPPAPPPASAPVSVPAPDSARAPASAPKPAPAPASRPASASAPKPAPAPASRPASAPKPAGLK